MPCIYIEHPPEVEIDGNGVRVTYNSGAEIYVRRFSRATFRRYIETAIRQLDDYEAAERFQIVEFKRSG